MTILKQTGLLLTAIILAGISIVGSNLGKEQAIAQAQLMQSTGSERSGQSEQDERKRQTSRGFLFDFGKCTRTARQEVTCVLMVTNTRSTARDLSFTIVSSIQMVDSGGNTYWWKRVNIGNRGNWTKVPAGVPIKLTIVFQKVAAGTEPVLLTLNGRTDEGTTEVEFR
jgi:hypothetical protein